jgi:hypothetical protein
VLGVGLSLMILTGSAFAATTASLYSLTPADQTTVEAGTTVTSAVAYDVTNGFGANNVQVWSVIAPSDYPEDEGSYVNADAFVINPNTTVRSTVFSVGEVSFGEWEARGMVFVGPFLDGDGTRVAYDAHSFFADQP